MENITGVVRQKMIDCGSKSDGIHAFLELLDSNLVYKLYRKDVYSVDDSFFDQFRDTRVIVSGEFEQEQWIKVKEIEAINIDK